MKLNLLAPLFLYTPLSLAQIIIIGHRGASGYRPEHTLASYELAVEQGADFIEPDIVITKDGILIIRHENEISGTTDVATKFPDRKITKKVDGVEMTGWFAEDFTLQEIKTLKAKERLAFRGHDYDNKFEVPTFAEFLEYALSVNKKRKKPIGIYPEIKHPSYFKSIGMPLEDKVVKQIEDSGWIKKGYPIFIQCFEMTTLKKLKTMTKAPLIFLMGDKSELPYDHVLNGDPRTYGDLTKPEALKELSQTLSGIGPSKRLIISEGADGKLMKPTSLIQDAHKVGLKVHPYTFRSDASFLHSSYKGDPLNEYQEFFKLGVDGVFSDFPKIGVEALRTCKAKL